MTLVRTLSVSLAAFALGTLAPAGFAGPCQSVASPSADEISVNAKGQGADPSAAKADAVREALRQAVGMFVDARTVTDGERIVSDRILSATGALVVSSKVIAGPNRLGDGTYEVECSVRIRRRSLIGSLTDAGFVVTGTLDGESATRVAETNFKNARDAATLLSERLDGMWSKLMVARMVDDKGVPLGDGEMPEAVKRDDGTMVVCANVQVYFHLEAYYTKFVPEIRPLLEALATKKSEWTTNRPAPDKLTHRSRFGGVPALWVVESGVEERFIGKSASDVTLWVSDGRDALGINEHYAGYLLPASLADTIHGAANRVTSGQFRLELLAADRSVVAAKLCRMRGPDDRDWAPHFLRKSDGSKDEQPIEVPVPDSFDQRLSGFLIFGTELYEAAPRFSGSERRTIAIEPRFLLKDLWWGRRYGWAWSDVLETRVELSLPPQDLATVRSYRITPVEAPASGQ